jgi:hypothetical protein
MKVRGKLLAGEIKEASRFLRSKWYWPKLLLRSSYGGLLFLALLWGTIAKAVNGDREHWMGLTIVWLVVIAILLWVVFTTRRSQQRGVQLLNDSLPDELVFDSEGIHAASADGRRSFRPWASLTGWREGDLVLYLKIGKTEGYVLVPLSELSASDRYALCSDLLIYLGEQQQRLT